MIRILPGTEREQKQGIWKCWKRVLLLFFDHLLIYFTFYTLGVSNGDKPLCHWGYGVITAG